MIKLVITSMYEVIMGENFSSIISSNEKKNVYELSGEKDTSTKERSNVDTKNIPNLALAMVAYKQYRKKLINNTEKM